MDRDNIEIEKSQVNLSKGLLDIIKRILCLLVPILCAFLGYFIAPSIWPLLSEKVIPEYFKLICSLVFLIIPTIIIFIHSRTLNPTIKITIKDKNREDEDN